MKQSAQQNHADAQLLYGTLIAQTVSTAEGMHWVTLAARNGNAEAKECIELFNKEGAAAHAELGRMQRCFGGPDGLRDLHRTLR